MLENKKKIIIKNTNQITNIRESWKYLTELLQIIWSESKPWVSLIELENIATNYIEKNNIKWAFKWYMWYPSNLCLSVNDCVVHWIPDGYILKNWDLLKIDAWISFNWWISDSAISLVVWWDFFNLIWKEMIDCAKDALDSSLRHIKKWSSIFNLSNSIWQKVKSKWFVVIENLTWHWVWKSIHEPPQIYNYGSNIMKKYTFEENMVIAIEPIISMKSTKWIEIKWKKRNIYTQYGDMWAQWEYTILVTKDGYEILAWIV